MENDAGKIIVQTDWVAAYGAILATFVFLWELFTWLSSRTRLRVKVIPNMRFIVGREFSDEMYLRVEATNIGGRQTTITTLAVQYYKNCFHYLIGRPDQSGVILKPVGKELPCLVSPGEYWDGLILATDELLEQYQKGIVCVEVYEVWRQRPFRRIVKGIKLEG